MTKTQAYTKEKNRSYSTNREYKDRLFRLIFGKEEHKEFLLSLYNALNHSSHDNIDELSITTIDDVIYVQMKNDVSCIISSHMNLYEQQSTINPNMPFREFEYCAKLYDKYVTEQRFDLYGKTPFKLPAPKCFVLYNGIAEHPEYVELKLSDAFETPSPGYEWTSFVYNINEGYNEDLMKHCESLKAYSAFVELVRKKVNSAHFTTREAIDEAVKEFIEKKCILSEIMESHRSEVIDVCLTEYNEEIHERNLREEGRNEERTTLILNALKYADAEQVKLILGVSDEDIQMAQLSLQK